MNIRGWFRTILKIHFLIDRLGFQYETRFYWPTKSCLAFKLAFSENASQWVRMVNLLLTLRGCSLVVQSFSSFYSPRGGIIFHIALLNAFLFLCSLAVGASCGLFLCHAKGFFWQGLSQAEQKNNTFIASRYYRTLFWPNFPPVGAPGTPDVVQGTRHVMTSFLFRECLNGSVVDFTCSYNNWWPWAGLWSTLAKTKITRTHPSVVRSIINIMHQFRMKS